MWVIALSRVAQQDARLKVDRSKDACLKVDRSRPGSILASQKMIARRAATTAIKAAAAPIFLTAR